MLVLSCWDLEVENGLITHFGILRAADERRRRVNDSPVRRAVQCEGLSSVKGRDEQQARPTARARDSQPGQVHRQDASGVWVELIFASPDFIWSS
jgi:hypothetical protein